MNPDNPANGNPNIFEIKDSNNVKHQVAPVNHTHDALVGQTVSLIVNNVEIEIEPANVPNLLRALADPDSTPTSESTKLVTSGGVKAALDAKQNTLTFDSTPTASSTNPVTSGGVKTALNGKADSVHTHIPSQIYGLIPTYIDYSGSELDLDLLVDENWGMNKVIVKNDTNDATTFASLFKSEEDLPVHLNGNGAATIAAGYYALCTIYKIDKDMNQDDEHPHDLCYFVTLDGIFDSGD